LLTSAGKSSPPRSPSATADGQSNGSCIEQPCYVRNNGSSATTYISPSLSASQQTEIEKKSDALLSGLRKWNPVKILCGIGNIYAIEFFEKYFSAIAPVLYYNNSMLNQRYILVVNPKGIYMEYFQ